METILNVDRLSINAELKSGFTRIVKELSFKIAPGEKLGIVGESGCGKTMTAMAMFGLLPSNCHADGEVTLNGNPLLGLSEKQMNEKRGREIVLIPQSGADFLNPSLLVRDQIYETLRRAGIKDKADLQKKAQELLEQVGFDKPGEVMGKYPFQLSGGMAQRIVLAIGLAFSPSLVIADEPTRGIDDETASLFIKQLGRMFSDSAVIVIIHNISVARTCRNILVMHSGEMMEYGRAEVILNFPHHPYTRSLIDALPSNWFKSGTVPDRGRINSREGCPFYLRCSVGTDACAKNSIALKEACGVSWRCFNA
jgi:oligopeptide/dipeptide ABC transporter ATP-binding protein